MMNKKIAANQYAIKIDIEYCVENIIIISYVTIISPQRGSYG